MYVQTVRTIYRHACYVRDSSRVHITMDADRVSPSAEHINQVFQGDSVAIPSAGVVLDHDSHFLVGQVREEADEAAQQRGGGEVAHALVVQRIKRGSQDPVWKHGCIDRWIHACGV